MSVQETKQGKQHIVSALCILAALLFTALGIWQLERRIWKLDLIAHVDQRVHAKPVIAPGPKDWPAITADHDAYRHVSITGHFLNNKETLVQAVTERGPGFWVMTPLRTDDGSFVLINRGFVPPDRRDPATRKAGQISGKITVTGLMRMTEPKGGFLHTNHPESSFWYSRDVTAIAATCGLKPAAPYFIDADATPVPDGLPVGGLTVIAFHNNHLMYALTWFSLAFIAMIGLILTGKRSPI